MIGSFDFSGSELKINPYQGDAVAMTWQEDDEQHVEDRNDIRPRRAQRTKFRPFEDIEETAAHREKRSGKRSHRQKTVRDHFWPDTGD
jgi:hypothetical protein